MALLNLPVTFVQGTIGRASDVNANFDAIRDKINGNINSDNLSPGSVTPTQLLANAVTTPKIADANVTTLKLADQAVTSAKIATGNVLTTHLSNGSVSSDKLVDSSVNASKLAPNSVGVSKLSDGAVTISKLGIANNQLEGAWIKDGTVGVDQLKDGNVTSAKLGTGSVTTEKIVDENVTNAKLAEGAVTLDKAAASIQDFLNVNYYTLTATKTYSAGQNFFVSWTIPELIDISNRDKSALLLSFSASPDAELSLSSFKLVNSNFLAVFKAASGNTNTTITVNIALFKPSKPFTTIVGS